MKDGDGVAMLWIHKVDGFRIEEEVVLVVVDCFAL